MIDELQWTIKDFTKHIVFLTPSLVDRNGIVFTEALNNRRCLRPYCDIPPGKVCVLYYMCHWGCLPG